MEVRLRGGLRRLLPALVRADAEGLRRTRRKRARGARARSRRARPPLRSERRLDDRHPLHLHRGHRRRALGPTHSSTTAKDTIMRSHHLRKKLLAAVAAALLAAAIAATTATAAPIGQNDRSADAYVPGVTDSSTGVLRALEGRRLARERFVRASPTPRRASCATSSGGVPSGTRSRPPPAPASPASAGTRLPSSPARCSRPRPSRSPRSRSSRRSDGGSRPDESRAR